MGSYSSAGAGQAFNQRGRENADPFCRMLQGCHLKWHPSKRTFAKTLKALFRFEIAKLLSTRCEAESLNHCKKRSTCGFPHLWGKLPKPDLGTVFYRARDRPLLSQDPPTEPMERDAVCLVGGGINLPAARGGNKFRTLRYYGQCRGISTEGQE